MDTQPNATTSTAVRPFRINVPQQELDALRQRLFDGLKARVATAPKSGGCRSQRWRTRIGTGSLGRRRMSRAWLR